MSKREVQRQMDVLMFGVTEVVPEDELREMLEYSIANNKPLTVKCGIDPTTPNIHIGHTIPYRKMRQFQDLGHKGVVIIGDYTASIGDPSGRDQSRPPLSQEEIEKNADTYMNQVFTIVDPSKTEVRRQSEWFTDTSLRDIITWAGHTTVAKLLSHDTFAKRLDEGLPLSLHELLYPVLQGIDSVEIKADVELGGSDQKFNVLMGRDYQRQRNMRPQVAMLMPLVQGTCGKNKMSKSLGNTIDITDEPFDKFGKVMSIPDDLMEMYYMHFSGLDEKQFNSTIGGLKDGSLHPNEAKKQLAQMMVSSFHGEETGAAMRSKFEAVFKEKKIPSDIPEYQNWRDAPLSDVLTAAKILSSKGEVRRMVEQGAVRIFEGSSEVERISDPGTVLNDEFAGKIIKVGKRKFLKLK